jgi:hypothetical protein
MLTKSDAMVLIHEFLKKIEEAGSHLAINDSKTIEKPYGWIFFYNSKKFIESGDNRYRLAGNGPLVVDKVTHVITGLASNSSIQDAISEYEKKR